MNRHSLSLFILAASSLLIGMTAPPSTAQINPKFAQDLLNNVLNRRCDRATEVSYRSNQLTSTPLNGTHVYIDAILRKIVTPGSPLRQSDSPLGCAADARETSRHELVIARAGETRRITLEPYPDSYLIYHLQSFSPDGNFLVADLQTVYAGGDGGNHVTIFDLRDNTVTVSTPTVCDELDFASFYGFATETEAIVLCEGYLGSTQRFEAINVQTGTLRRVAGMPPVMSYGLPVGAPEITKVQRFQ
ncbi:MAG: hypothetical protein AAFQ74_08535 [Cyanobacteria bacterium J06623_4]